MLSLMLSRLLFFSCRLNFLSFFLACRTGDYSLILSLFLYFVRIWLFMLMLLLLRLSWDVLLLLFFRLDEKVGLDRALRPFLDLIGVSVLPLFS